MRIGIYKATLKHDNGKLHITVVSLSGKQGAKTQIMQSESCPESAIIALKELKNKNTNPIKTSLK
jgi:hypothetical protein